MRTKKALWITVTIAAILLVMGAVVIAKPSQARVLPEGISFNGNSLAGLTPDAAKDKITEYMSYYNDRTIELTIGNETKKITMEDIGLAIDGEAEALTDLEEAIPYGNVFQRYKQEKDLEQEPVNIKASVSYNGELLSNIVTTMANKNEVAVAEPTYKKTSSGFVTTPGSNGIAYDETQIIADLKKHLEETIPESGESNVIQYTAKATITEPNLRVGAYDDLKDDVLGTYTTKFDSNNVDRTMNLEIACRFLNGIVLMPDQQASLLDILKPTEANGYRKAGTIINGKTEMDTAGGICQVATTLYDALLYAEVGIVYRNNHSLASDYVDYSWDAMIHPSGADFKFKNTLDHPIYIEAGISRQGEKSPITITVYGTEYRAANRKVEYYTKVLDVDYPDPLYVVKRYTPDTLPAEGKNYATPRLYAQRAVTASPAIRAELWKRVTIDGQVVEDKRANGSRYKSTTGEMWLAWDMTMIYWTSVDENGFEVANYVFRDGRYWDKSKETEVNLSDPNIKIAEWVGQKLNEDGSVKQEPTKPKPTTPEQTTPEQTTPEQTTPEQTTPEQTTPEQTTPEATTPEATTPVATPEATTPAATPEATTPAATPEATTPAATPEATTPAATPEATTPAATPEATTPVETTPEAAPVVEDTSAVEVTE